MLSHSVVRLRFPPLKYGERYSQTLLITVISTRPDRPTKRFIVNTIASDQGCSMADPVIIDASLMGEDQP
ncbi:hypothetical protein [Rosenbergiella metrosideri]|uniref:hypothetical protein n=1 Tax=Rosenbergiella metrosideri TaxID=2921185 RepID=UPI001F4FA036|nr:hypothetical protein [Rosenbergiella metrosideri]